MEERRVVVTGTGVISPVGNSTAEFWNSLVQGKHGIAPITRFDTADSRVKVAAEVRNFDAKQYMKPLEVKRSDLFCRYAVAAAQQAVDESGIIGTVDRERFGVYFGSGIGGIGSGCDNTRLLLDNGPDAVSPLYVTTVIPNIAAGNLAIRFGAGGPCMSYSMACSTGTNAIGEAYRAIRHGYADAILAGGAEAPVVPLAIAGFSACRALSESADPDSASLPFDIRRSGFVMGEGAGALILEEREHALERGARIIGEIAGYGSTCDAYHITSPMPDGAGMAGAMLQALRTVNTPKRCVYINAHGTGTVANDRIETMAIRSAFAQENAQLLISSTKSMTGHMMGAAGAVEAVAALYALKEGIIPPTAGLTQPDPECDLDYVPVTARRAEPDCALSSSMGFGGHNACLAFVRGDR